MAPPYQPLKIPCLYPTLDTSGLLPCLSVSVVLLLLLVLLVWSLKVIIRSPNTTTQNIPFLLDTGRIPWMGFELGQGHSCLESINEFKERMEDALTEAKAALAKSKDEMSKYYDHRWTPTPVYQPGDKVYLDASDIQMTRPSQKLAHKRLGLFTIIRKVGNGAY